MTPDMGNAESLDGHVEAFTRLYREHAPRIVNGLRQAYGSGPPDPEDITQLVFQRVLERRDLSDIQNIRGFLWRTARNLLHSGSIKN